MCTCLGLSLCAKNNLILEKVLQRIICVIRRKIYESFFFRFNTIQIDDHINST